MFIPSDRKELLFGYNVAERIKPIFHSNAKFLALGVGVGQYPGRQNFALGIPICWYLGSNANPLICVLPDAKPKICVLPDAKPKICVLPDAKPKCKPVEYRLRWVPTQNSGVGHVHFMFFHKIVVSNFFSLQIQLVRPHMIPSKSDLCTSHCS